MSYALKTIDALAALNTGGLTGAEKIAADNGTVAGHVTTGRIAQLAIDVSAPLAHEHEISDVNGLQTVLDDKALAADLAAKADQSALDDHLAAAPFIRVPWSHEGHEGTLDLTVVAGTNAHTLAIQWQITPTVFNGDTLLSPSGKLVDNIGYIVE